MRQAAEVDEAIARAEPRLSYAIARLQQMVLAGISERVAQHDLTTLQFTTLSVLSRHGAPLSTSQLARRAFMTPQSMSEVIHALERKGSRREGCPPQSPQDASGDAHAERAARARILRRGSH